MITITGKTQKSKVVSDFCNTHKCLVAISDSDKRVANYISGNFECFTFSVNNISEKFEREFFNVIDEVKYNEYEYLVVYSNLNILNNNAIKKILINNEALLDEKFSIVILCIPE